MLDAPTDNPMTKIAQVKQLQEEIARLTVQAKDEALSQAHQAIDSLNALGFAYRLAEDGKAGGMPAKKRKASRVECNVCGFTTDPPHDARKHKLQGDDKQPFSDEELVQLGLCRIG